MSREIVEIKARCTNLARVRRTLAEHMFPLSRIERQTDTYFRCDVGRLKLREGESETKLVYYQRPDIRGPKRSRVLLYRPSDAPALKDILTAALGVYVVVEKRREIYIEGNVEIHLDQVRDLGSFVEIEVLKEDGAADESILRRQCRFYMDLLGIGDAETVEGSYCELIAGVDATKASVGRVEGLY